MSKNSQFINTQNRIMFLFNCKTSCALVFHSIFLSVPPLFHYMHANVFCFLKMQPAKHGCSVQDGLYCIYKCIIEGHVFFLFVIYIDVRHSIYAEHVDHQQQLDFCD